MQFLFVWFHCAAYNYVLMPMHWMWQASELWAAICLSPLKLQHHLIMLNFWISQHRNSLFFLPTTSSLKSLPSGCFLPPITMAPPSMDGLPPSTDSLLPLQNVSSLPQYTVGLLPPSMHNQPLPSMNSLFPPLTNSLWPPLMHGCLHPLTHGLLPWWMSLNKCLFPTVSSLPQWMVGLPP